MLDYAALSVPSEIRADGLLQGALQTPLPEPVRIAGLVGAHLSGMPQANFGSFVALQEATNISALGGWRKHLASLPA